MSPTGCPVSASAAAFNPFEEAYAIDPAKVLKWSRDREPVFYSPEINYWVVTRYEDIKAVFRDNILYSPAVVLEPMTPPSDEAREVLASYDYAMNRTLVNEDEPAHMERRRVLMKSFELDELAHHEPMVRKLTKEYVDRLVDKGQADLVDEMLWGIPLTVALHFLGVPEEDMETLRQYSIDHTVNTWGRPSPEEQVKVADGVGKFWQFAGQVLEKMRQDPSGNGWMEYAIRKQKELPDVVTDSYLHSMMMAGIVAAHETTANAAANMFRLLLDTPDVWEQLCENPALIPNAVEECLRFTGSISGWRRITTDATEIDGVEIPKGARLLIVAHSGNHDERHFEDPDEFDIFRQNSSEHLSFGYGSHQCLGKNLARMEMRIFLEEFTRRLPHMRLKPGAKYSYLPNTSFRGPDHLWVQWDPAKNPERNDPTALTSRADFPMGAPSLQDTTRQLTVAGVRREADGVIGLVLEDPSGRSLPKWSPGAHVELQIDQFKRKYSLCGGRANPAQWDIAVLREEAGRGGSKLIHDTLKPGMSVQVRGPKNHFRLDETGDHFVLIAGGIGITPILTMADRLKDLGKDYELHYAGRTRDTMAFLDRLEQDHGERLHLYAKSAGLRMELPALIAGLVPEAAIYACGPDRLLAELQELTGDHPGGLHFEHFAPVDLALDPAKEHAFDVVLSDSDLSVHVPADKTVLQALRAVGFDVTSDCEEGICGSCEVAVLDGEIDHRDKVLTKAERDKGDRVLVCCSRACGKKLTLAL